MSASLVNNKYRVTRRIGGGSFGEIYLGVGPSGEKVAVKFEKHGSRCPQLRHEYKVYREVASCHGFCRVHHFGTQDNYNVMVMDLLGPSLEDLFNRCGRRFSLKTVLQLADQMLERVDTFHSRHLIHRDIKPANFVIGTVENCNIVFCVDFGLSKRYRHPKNLQHIPHRDGRSLTGTPRYASINNHLGIEQSRRDDLESIAYVLIYFLKGSLPWQGLKAKNAQKKYRLIMEKKQQVSIAQLCAGCPSQFGEFLAYTRSLKFDSKPDIPFLRKLFRDLYHSQGCASSGKLWDWDSAEADMMLLQGSDNLPPGGPPILTGGAGGGGGGPMSQGGDDNLDYDPQDGMRAQSANAKRAVTANTTAARPGTALGSWGFGDAKAVSGQVAEDQAAYDAKAAAATSRSAGSLHRDREEVGADGQPRRPHTAHGGRVDQSEEEDNGHVVAGARGMMQYRRARTGQSDPAPPQQAAPVPTTAASNSRWTAGLFSGSNPDPNAKAAQPPAAGGKTPATAAATTGVRKPPSGNGAVATSAPAAAWANDAMGRPKSAGGVAAPAGSSRPVASAGTQRSTTNSNGSGGGAQNMSSGNSGAGGGANSSAAAASNSMSYGSLKNRFLSGPKKTSSKLFSLAR